MMAFWAMDWKCPAGLFGSERISGIIENYLRQPTTCLDWTHLRLRYDTEVELGR
jgi:hypothetical protein